MKVILFQFSIILYLILLWPTGPRALDVSFAGFAVCQESLRIFEADFAGSQTFVKTLQ